MTDGGNHPMPDWLKTAVSVVLAAGSAYMAIRVDLANTMKDVDYLKQTATRHELTIERLRDRAAERDAAADQAARAAADQAARAAVARGR